MTRTSAVIAATTLDHLVDGKQHADLDKTLIHARKLPYKMTKTQDRQ